MKKYNIYLLKMCVIGIIVFIEKGFDIMRKIICLLHIFGILLLSSCAGDSAYDLAVENGFNGTIEDYLESLKGQDSHITIEEIFNSLVEIGEYNEDEYTKFLLDYLNYSIEDDSVIMNNSLQSSVSLKVTFGSIIKNTYYGSGVIYKLDGNGVAYIITNHHVLSNPFDREEISSKINVYMYGMEYESYAYEASYVGSLSEYDISVIKVNFDINYNAKYLKEINIYEDRIYAGDSVYAIGNPLGSGLSITSGIISVDSEMIDTGYNVRVMRIDVAVNGGNSGGPLFNSDGLLIGIIDAKIVDLEVEGICYALPISAVSNIANNIINNNSDAKVVSIDFGYSTLSSFMYYDVGCKKYYIKEIVQVGELSIVSDAYKEGLRTSDQITSIIKNGQTYIIERYFTITDILLGCNINDELIINTYRVDTKQNSSYTLTLKY